MNNQEKRESGRFEDVGRALDRELQRLVDFVNERVVPAARDDTESLLRKTSEKLNTLADRLAARRQSGAAGEAPAEPAAEPKVGEPGSPEAGSGVRTDASGTATPVPEEPRDEP
jgi:hypothetical protein